MPSTPTSKELLSVADEDIIYLSTEIDAELFLKRVYETAFVVSIDVEYSPSSVLDVISVACFAIPPYQRVGIIHVTKFDLGDRVNPSLPSLGRILWTHRIPKVGAGLRGE